MPQSFLNRFAQALGLGRPKTAAPSPICLAVFGKHRAWDDHIPGFGLTQPALIEFHSWLYGGISGNVDNGEWDNLRKSGQLQPFGHTLLWIELGQCIAARCWQSVDGKGRDQYPMIVAALSHNQPISWVIREAVPALKTLQHQCIEAASAADVERRYLSAEAALRQVVSTDASGNPVNVAGDADAFTSIANRPELGPDRLGFLRVLYFIERERPYVRVAKHLQSRSPARPFSLRVPMGAEALMPSVELWIRLLSNHPELISQLLVCVPDHGKWLDLMIGRPGPSQLFTMRAPPEVFPCTTDVPYTLDATFINRVNHFLDHIKVPPGTAATETWP